MPLLPVYNRHAFAIERGEGAYLYTEDGKRYLDFISGVAVNCLGHSHPALNKALSQQAEKLWHVSNLFEIPGARAYARALTAQCFADTVFFCNSGAEAIECTVKMLRKFHHFNGNAKRYRVITFSGAFHGRTLTAIWASKKDPLIQDGFGPATPGFDRVEFGNLEAVKAAITDETAAILIEPIQGDGGINVADKAFLKGLRELADQHGLLLCFDEIQSGAGRTGALYAHQLFDVEPDIVASAKGLGGGFPLGACLATDRAAEGMSFGTHGTTYGGNPLAMAVGSAVLEHLLAPGFLDQVQAMGKILHDTLQDVVSRYPKIFVELRGVGLMLGLKTHGSHAEFAQALAHNGLLCALASDNVIRLLPPLIIDQTHIDEALAVIEKTAKAYA